MTGRITGQSMRGKVSVTAAFLQKPIRAEMAAFAIFAAGDATGISTRRTRRFTCRSQAWTVGFHYEKKWASDKGQSRT